MPDYPWPKHLIVTVDEVNDRARITVIFPKRFPFRDRILTVVGDSIAAAQQIAWAQFAFSGRCNHEFIPDDDGRPGSGVCVKCLSRFDHILVDPASLDQTHQELTVQDILNQKSVTPAQTVVFPTCWNPDNRRQHLATEPQQCEEHGRARYRPGSARDAVNAIQEISEEIDEDDYTDAEILAAVSKVNELLSRKSTSVMARFVLRYGLRQLQEAPLASG
jgi:hypothetical protein